MKKILTVGIPTYKRPESLAKLLNLIFSTPQFHENVEVVIINDSGTDEFDAEYDEAIYKFNWGIRFIKNEMNVGFPKSFVKLILECQTSYLLVMADDDLLISEHFLEILYFLKEKAPDLLSPQWIYKNGRFGRGVKQTRKVKIEEHRLCSGHAPGVIFNVNKSREFIPLVENRIISNCAATLTYPLVSLTIPLILAANNCYWFGKPIAREGDAHRSGIKDAKGNHYSSLASRIQQIAAFDDYILSFRRVNQGIDFVKHH